MQPSKEALDYAFAVRDWIASPHDPDENLDLRLSELTQAHFEALFEACRLYEAAIERECHCDKPYVGKKCVRCNCLSVARMHFKRFAETSAKLNPDWTESLENDLLRCREHCNAWLWAYSALISIVEGCPNWDKCKPEYSIPNTEEILHFPGITLAIEFRQSFEQMERRLHHVEGLLEAQIQQQNQKQI